MSRAMMITALAVMSAALAAQGAFRPWGGGEHRHSEIRTAIEAYRIDWNTFPPSTTYLYRNRDQVSTFAGGQLTTPIAYLTRMPVDIFSFDELHWTAYVAGEDGFAIWSAGPDGDYDFPWQTEFHAGSPEMSTHALRWEYDGTNGILSSGDLITVVP
ncbi:hypothetical protein JXA47_08040 [Candidatus Sumerlaeota bacterium]|nr:hypothetical protein [Candidatus Sumerlaeota bacterium]